MAFRYRRATTVQRNLNLGVVETTNPTAHQTEDEQMKQNKIVSRILKKLGRTFVDEWQIESGHMVFLLPPDSRNRGVVESEGGEVITENELGTRVRVPLHFSWWDRNKAMIYNPTFLIMVGLLALCTLWMGWKWLTHDNLFSTVFH